jgi:hypothetical protein
LAEIADRQRRDGWPEQVIRGKDAVVAVTMPSRRRHEVGHTIEKLEGLEFEDAVLFRGGGLALPAGADPSAALVAGERVADAFGAAVAAREKGEPLEREGGPGAGAQEVREGRSVPLFHSTPRAVAPATDRRCALRRRVVCNEKNPAGSVLPTGSLSLGSCARRISRGDVPCGGI